MAFLFFKIVSNLGVGSYFLLVVYGFYYGGRGCNYESFFFLFEGESLSDITFVGLISLDLLGFRFSYYFFYFCFCFVFRFFKDFE